MEFGKLLQIIFPLILVEIALKIFALIRLFRDNVKYFPKWVWALVIIFVSTIGPVLFLAVGRQKE